MPIAVVAIGGNSLVKPGERGTLEEQRANLSVTCEGIAAVMGAGYRVVATHGNGPQVGDALLRSEMAAAQVPPLTLDGCGSSCGRTTNLNDGGACPGIRKRESKEEPQTSKADVRATLANNFAIVHLMQLGE